VSVLAVDWNAGGSVASGCGAGGCGAGYGCDGAGGRLNKVQYSFTSEQPKLLART